MAQGGYYGGQAMIDNGSLRKPWTDANYELLAYALCEARIDLKTVKERAAWESAVNKVGEAVRCIDPYAPAIEYLVQKMRKDYFGRG